MATKELQELAQRIKALSPQERLRLAADLLDSGRLDLAHRLVRKTVDEMDALDVDLRMRALGGGQG